MKMGKKKKIILIVAGILLLLVALGIGGMSLQVGKMVAEGLLYQNEGNDTKGNTPLFHKFFFHKNTNN